MERETILERGARVAERTPDAIRDVRGTAEEAGLSHPILVRPEESVGSRSAACLAEIAGSRTR